MCLKTCCMVKVVMQASVCVYRGIFCGSSNDLVASTYNILTVSL